MLRHTKPRKTVIWIAVCALAAILLFAVGLRHWSKSRSPIVVDLARPGAAGDVAASVREAFETGPWSPPRDVTIRVDEQLRIHDMMMGCSVNARRGRNDEIVAHTGPLTLPQFMGRLRQLSEELHTTKTTADGDGFNRASKIVQTAAIVDDELPLIVARLYAYPYTVEVVVRPGYPASTFVLQYVVSSPTRQSRG